jgi:quinoprotein glucose dehydrogenase
LEPVISELVKSAPAKVAALAIHAASQLKLKKAAPLLSEIFAQTNRPAEVRVEALRTLAELDKARLDELLPSAREDRNEEVRKAAALLEVATTSTGVTARLAMTLDRGSVGEKQSALLALGSVKEAAADDLIAQWLDNLKAGKIQKELELDLVEAAAKRTAPAVKEKLAAYQGTKPAEDQLAQYREALYGGDSPQGRKIFFDRPDAQCVRCHRIKGIGGDVGPDLTHIGALKPREYFLESIILPNKQIAPGFESVTVSLKNDETYAGVLKSETADQLVINTPQNGLMTIKKADIQTRAKSLSPMPEGIGQILSKQDIRNVVEYLSGLK